MKMNREEQEWLDAILAKVAPVTLAEAERLLEAWKKWAWFQAHDEDCRQDFEGEHGTRLRMIVTLIQTLKQREAARVQ